MTIIYQEVIIYNDIISYWQRSVPIGTTRFRINIFKDYLDIIDYVELQNRYEIMEKFREDIIEILFTTSYKKYFDIKRYNILKDGPDTVYHIDISEKEIIISFFIKNTQIITQFHFLDPIFYDTFKNILYRNKCDLTPEFLIYFPYLNESEIYKTWYNYFFYKEFTTFKDLELFAHDRNFIDSRDFIEQILSKCMFSKNTLRKMNNNKLTGDVFIANSMINFTTIINKKSIIIEINNTKYTFLIPELCSVIWDVMNDIKPMYCSAIIDIFPGLSGLYIEKCDSINCFCSFDKLLNCQHFIFYTEKEFNYSYYDNMREDEHDILIKGKRLQPYQTRSFFLAYNWMKNFYRRKFDLVMKEIPYLPGVGVEYFAALNSYSSNLETIKL